MSAQCPCGHERYGYTIKEGVLSKNVERRKHQLRMWKGRVDPAWCVQRAIIQYHKDEIKRVVITDTSPGGAVWSTNVSQLLLMGDVVTNEEYGTQIRLPLYFWEMEGESPIQQLSLL